MDTALDDQDLLLTNRQTEAQRHSIAAQSQATDRWLGELSAAPSFKEAQILHPP